MTRDPRLHLAQIIEPAGVLRPLASIAGDLWYRRDINVQSQPLIQPCHGGQSIRSRLTWLSAQAGPGSKRTVVPVMPTHSAGIHEIDRRRGPYGLFPQTPPPDPARALASAQPATTGLRIPRQTIYGMGGFGIFQLHRPRCQKCCSQDGRTPMHALRLRTACCGLLIVLLMVLPLPAESLGFLSCSGSEVSDSFDINNGGADGHFIGILVAATSELVGGPPLDPRIEVRRQFDGAPIACNDDHGSSFGGCSLNTTFPLGDLAFINGPIVLYAIDRFDSFVIFLNPPGGVRVTVRASLAPAPGRAACGNYFVQVFGF